MIYKNQKMDCMEHEMSESSEEGKTDFHNTYSEGWGGKHRSGCLEYLEDK